MDGQTELRWLRRAIAVPAVVHKNYELPSEISFLCYQVFGVPQVLGQLLLLQGVSIAFCAEALSYLLYRTSNFFCNFIRHVFGTRVEVNIIMQRNEVPCWLSSDPKVIDLQ